MSRGVLVFILLGSGSLFACSETEPLPQVLIDAGVDAGADAGGAVLSCDWEGSPGRPALTSDRLTGDGCNSCNCSEVGGVPYVSCTAALCPSGRPDVGPGADVVDFGPAVLRCQTHADCPELGFCHWDPGCGETEGWCARVWDLCDGSESYTATATTTDPVFCGCDDITYAQPDARCFDRAWSDRGACGQ